MYPYPTTDMDDKTWVILHSCTVHEPLWKALKNDNFWFTGIAEQLNNVNPTYNGTCQGVGYIRQRTEQSVLEVDVLVAEKTDEPKGLTRIKLWWSDDCQIRRNGVGQFHQKWSREGQLANRWQGHGSPRLIDACGEWRLARVVRSHRRATVGQITEILLKLPLNIQGIAAHCIWGIIVANPSRVPILDPVHRQMGERVSGQWSSSSLLHYVDGPVHERHIPWEEMAPGCTMGRRQASGGSVMLWAMFCWETLGPGIHVDVTLTRTT